MSFLKKIKRATIVNRLLDEKLHEQVLHEMESGIRRDGLWAMALRKSSGNEQEAKGVYIGLRIQSIEDEAEIVEALSLDSPAQEIAPPKEILDLSRVHGVDRETVSECANLLSTHGFTLSGSKDNWSIKVNSGTMTTYCYSINDLEKNAKTLVKSKKK